MKPNLLIAGCLFITQGIFCQVTERLEKEISSNLEQHAGFYRYLHQNPELSFQESGTAAHLSAELEKIGFAVTRDIGGHGFVGVLANGAGPVVMIRTDMDALPLEEKTGLPYASRITGVMHACGHDMHMTVWLGTAKVLASLKKYWQGTLIMLAQPAEEKGAGAAEMIAGGLFRNFPVPDYILAYHVNPELKAGTVGYRSGAFMAGVNSVDITVHGVGGHGAMPQQTIDPIVLASRMVLAFQTIPSREINPLKPVVVTVGSIHGGTVHNIIPDEVKMQLTVRFYEDEVYEEILAGLVRISSGIAMSAGLPESLYPEVKPLDALTPPLVNDGDLTRRVAVSFTSAIGQQNVIRVEPVTAAEDFSLYGRTDEKIPVSMFWLGATNPEKYEEFKARNLTLPGLHSPEFYPDFEPAYRTGVLCMSRAVLDLFGSEGSR